jgi:hypothetical protein
MADLNELRNTRVKMAERAKEKLESRFTELPTPVYNPPPLGMPTNSEAVQRVLDRRALEVREEEEAAPNFSSRRSLFLLQNQLNKTHHILNSLPPHTPPRNVPVAFIIPPQLSFIILSSLLLFSLFSI